MAALIKGTYATDLKTIEELLERKITEDNEYRRVALPELFIPIVTKEPLKCLLYTAYSLFHDSGKMAYHDWLGKNCDNESLYALYGLLDGLGYEMSDEEKAYQDGTHKLFEV